MEKMLQKLARQLDTLDEASLMSLWSKYATLTSRFEPTKEWEEAALVFSLIQAKHWKNQLFNYTWSQQRRPPSKEGVPFADNPIDLDYGLETLDETEEDFETDAPEAEECSILPFDADDVDAVRQIRRGSDK